MRSVKDLLSLFEGPIFPVGYVGGRWLLAGDNQLWEQRNPSAWRERIGRVPLATGKEVRAAVRAAGTAQRDWAKSSVEARKQVLLLWAKRLLEAKTELARAMAWEIGKPITLGEEEVRFAANLIRTTAQILDRERSPDSSRRASFSVRRRPVGVVGIITPWNNPLAMPAGKLSPAIGFGNGTVWKAAVQAPRTSILALQALRKAGCPRGLVNLLFGEKETARDLILDPGVKAISLTGSFQAGRAVAGLASSRLKPVQLELGGNNAVIILPDSDLERAAGELAVSAFSFSGQRCTAPRRFIVHKGCRRLFEEALVSAVRSLRLGSPFDRATQVGPLISRRKQREMKVLVQKSLGRGAKILCGGKIPDSWKNGCWFEPTILFSSGQDLPLVTEESFGPVAVLQVAGDIDHALGLLNAVPHGLVAGLYSKDRSSQGRFLEKAECGVLKLNRTTLGVSPDAPFGGWKASGLGPFEHGIWDREFYTRLQTVYE